MGRKLIAIDLHWVQVRHNRTDPCGSQMHHLSAAWDLCEPDAAAEMVQEAQRYVDKNVGSGEWVRAVIHHYPVEEI